MKQLHARTAACPRPLHPSSSERGALLPSFTSKCFAREGQYCQPLCTAGETEAQTSSMQAPLRNRRAASGCQVHSKPPPLCCPVTLISLRGRARHHVSGRIFRLEFGTFATCSLETCPCPTKLEAARDPGTYLHAQTLVCMSAVRALAKPAAAF